MRCALLLSALLPIASGWRIPQTRRELLRDALATLAVTTALPKVAGAESIQERLNKFGLPPVEKAPNGYSTVLELYGRGGGDRQKLLVKFDRPSLWVLVKPSVDVNGEDGTLSTGDYQKGDNAALFVTGAPPNGAQSLSDKKFVSDVFAQAISQKSANIYENFKVTKVKPGVTDNGADYFLVDFQYDLLTGAGFVVARKGVGAITAIGKGTQAMVAATTEARYKKVEKDLRQVVESFRVYDGSSAAVARMYE